MLGTAFHPYACPTPSPKKSASKCQLSTFNLLVMSLPSSEMSVRNNDPNSTNFSPTSPVHKSLCRVKVARRTANRMPWGRQLGIGQRLPASSNANHPYYSIIYQTPQTVVYSGPTGISLCVSSNDDGAADLPL